MVAILEKKRYPSDLSLKQWEILKPLIPKVKTGCQWIQLPNDYPSWRTV